MNQLLTNQEKLKNFFETNRDELTFIDGGREIKVTFKKTKECLRFQKSDLTLREIITVIENKVAWWNFKLRFEHRININWKDVKEWRKENI